MKKKSAITKLNGKGLAKKILGIVTISTIGLSAILGLTGCTTESTENQIRTPKNVNEYEFLNDAYILVPNEKGEYVLHKGAIHCFTKNGAYREAKYGSDKLDLDCGENVYTNDYKAYESNPKQEGHYTKVCEDCFFGHEN